MNEEVGTTIEQVLAEKAADGRIPCAVLRKAAEDLGVSYKEAGAAANDAEIKVSDCELGCF